MMADHKQYVMNGRGELELEQPRTWDGEPIYSVETVREGLFDPTAFEQLPGQIAFEDGDDGR